MKQNEELRFNPDRVSRERFCSVARSFNGLPYDESATVAVPAGRAWAGSANCFGVLLLAIRECGLLHPKVSENLSLPPMIWGQKKEKTLWEIIRYNFTEVPRDQMRAGDILLFRYHDLDVRLKEPHHVGLCVNDKPRELLHANQTSRRTHIVAMDVLFLKRIEHCYSMNNFQD